MSSWLKVEFHCHSIYSKDSLVPIPALLEAARRKDIDRIVITDHNTIQGALAAKALEPERVIVGEEVLTDQGELLAVFVREELPKGLPALEAIDRLRKQGAFISVSHPFDLRRHGWRLENLLTILPYVDAIETFNARCLGAAINEAAQRFALEHNLAGTVGSDAHSIWELGNASLNVPLFEDPEGLRAVIRQARPDTRLAPLWVRFFSTYAKIYKRFQPYRP